jgi:hypothetical protein
MTTAEQSPAESTLLTSSVELALKYADKAAFAEFSKWALTLNPAACTAPGGAHPTPSGPEGDEYLRFLATVPMHKSHAHLQAWRVTTDRDDMQVLDVRTPTEYIDDYVEEFDTLLNLVGGAAVTTTFGPYKYVVAITPHQD